MGRCRVRPAQRKYPEELREPRGDGNRDPCPGGAQPGDLTRVGRKLGIHPEVLRTQVRQAEIDGEMRPGATSEVSIRIAELEKVRESRRANEILKGGKCIFREQTRSQVSALVGFVVSHCGRFGI